MGKLCILIVTRKGKLCSGIGQEEEISEKDTAAPNASVLNEQPTGCDVKLTGSQGERDCLAGNYETLTVRRWTSTDIAHEKTLAVRVNSWHFGSILPQVMGYPSFLTAHGAFRKYSLFGHR